MDSALACFQWGVLAYRADRLSRAIEWLERAARLEGGKNYWYQFLLGYLEDKAGYTDDAFRNYDIALLAAARIALGALQPGPNLPRARPVGLGSRRHQQAALEQLKGRPEATKVRLELAYLYQQVGDFAQARAGVRRRHRGRRLGHLCAGRSLEPAPTWMPSRGRSRRPGSEYDALILEDLTDTAARQEPRAPRAEAGPGRACRSST